MFKDTKTLYHFVLLSLYWRVFCLSQKLNVIDKFVKLICLWVKKIAHLIVLSTFLCMNDSSNFEYSYIQAWRIEYWDTIFCSVLNIFWFIVYVCPCMCCARIHSWTSNGICATIWVPGKKLRSSDSMANIFNLPSHLGSWVTISRKKKYMEFYINI